MTRTLLTNGTVFDGTGAAPSVADVVIEAGTIIDVGPGLDGDDAIDCTDHLVTPGLFDCHVHFMVDGDFSANTHITTPFSLPFFQAIDRMERTLACGITTVREAGGADLGVKQARDLGLVRGPRMQLSIAILSQTGGHGDSWEVCGAHLPGMLDPHPGRPHSVVDGPLEMRRRVREVIRAGADVIKVCTSGGVISPRSNPHDPQFRMDELDELVAEATAAGRFVMAHAQAAEGIKNAIRAGIRSIEHGVYLDDEGIDMMLEAGTYLVPTLIAPRGVLESVERGADLPATIVDKARAAVESHDRAIARAIDAGVKIAMGTDSGVTPHGQNLRELAEMERLGMSPGEVFEASTRVSAELLGVDDEVGTLQPGKHADVVLFRGTELAVDDLRSRVATVIQDGQVVVAG